ncbi:hypothetical protein HJC23_003842 [Cyclotella cryptica]|uniref:Magnesium transporter n=1 Tax=Cyclotella cryptica TaxID=29204 RepID=A0ABD3PZ99_9STRA|eukprot:CCRYP_009972-RA/>CCRYP_009972-RA protein AED:0.41 eAED:0.41 QI:0/-1/0/1/-1/1/1/0/670
MSPRRPNLPVFARNSSNTEDSGAVYTDNMMESLTSTAQRRRWDMDHTMRTAASAFEERLHEMVVFELREDGTSEYQTMTLRALYNYVVSSIAQSCRDANLERVKMQALEERSRRRLTGRLVRFEAEGGDYELDHDDNDDDAGGVPPTPASSSRQEQALMNQVTPSANEPSVHPPHLPSLSSSSPPSLAEEGGSTPLTSNTHKVLRSTSSETPSSSSFRHQRQMSLTALPGTNPNSTVNHPAISRERLGGYLHPRDMRRLVTPFSNSNEPQLMVRRHVMLLNFDPLRAIVLRDRLLVLVPDGADSILITLEKRVRGGLAEIENDVFGSLPEYNNYDLLSSNGKGKRNSFEMVNTSSNLDEADNATTSVFEGMVKMTKKRLHSNVETESNKLTGGETEHTAAEEEETTDRDDDYCNEWEEIPNVDWSDVPYELLSVDAVLQTVTAMLADEARQVTQRTVAAVHELRGDSDKRRGSKISGMPGDHAQERLRWLKDEINKMEGRVQGFVRAMNEMLDEDEDMALMNLSRLLTHPERFVQPVSQEILQEESDEPELILEAYLQQALSVVNELELLKAQIMTTQEQISMTLDAMRNKLLYINTLLSLASLCVATGSFIGSLFGMNLHNPFEDQDTDVWFLKVTLGTTIGIILLFFILAWFFYKQTSGYKSFRKKRM